MLDIFKYTELHKFLTDAWQEKRSRNPAFSMSSWARQLGLENSSPLSLAFSGKRCLPKKYLPQIIKTLDLDSEQAIYLEALLDLARARTPEQKLLYMNRLKELSPGQAFNAQVVDEFKFLSSPLHCALIEMIDLKKFSADPAWIQERLQFPATQAEIQEALDRMLQLGLIKEENGKLQKTHRHLTTVQDVADLGTKNYHKGVSELAAMAIFTQELEQREFNSYAFNMSKSKVPKAKAMIRKFISDFLSECEANPGEGDETFQFNLQLFQNSK